MSESLESGEGVRRFLKDFGRETESLTGADRALYVLLREHEADLPDIAPDFHKMFRQVDVTPSAAVDIAIWHLIHASKEFGECFERALVRNGYDIGPPTDQGER